ncbi:unnamed protein product [Discosporangium mesarthrocarpum]
MASRVQYRRRWCALSIDTDCPQAPEPTCQSISPPHLLSRNVSSQQWLNGKDLVDVERLVRIGKLDNGATSRIHLAVEINTLHPVVLKEIFCQTREDRDMVRQEIAALQTQWVPLLGTRRTRAPAWSLEERAVERDENAWLPRRSHEGNEMIGPLKGKNTEINGREECDAPTWGNPNLVSANVEEVAETRQVQGRGEDEEAETPCPFIVSYYGCTFRNGNGSHLEAETVTKEASTVNILMEYQSGGDLQHWLSENLPVSEPWLARIARQSLLALHSLHRRSKVHRDVKPANLLLSASGVIKLVDFGLTVQTDEDGKCSSMVGTFHYMSPERLRVERYGAKSDVYSLGLSLAALALGECPVPQATGAFDQLSYSEQAVQLVQQRVEEGGFSEAFLDFLTSAVATDPKERLGTEGLLKHCFLSMEENWPQTRKCKAVLQALSDQQEMNKVVNMLTPDETVHRISQARVASGCTTASNLDCSSLAPLLHCPERILQERLAKSILESMRQSEMDAEMRTTRVYSCPPQLKHTRWATYPVGSLWNQSSLSRGGGNDGGGGSGGSGSGADRGVP